MSGELERAKRAAEEAWRRKWEQQPPDEEPIYHYAIGLDCAPSVFEQIQRVIATQKTYNRTYRYYPAADGKNRRE
ncbi:hypothetical protein [Eggerthella timonensis]|uniref:hypothetical protein n=1 Tax=Eggerthella timonensis TaxID=1871008 RepID=UPI000C75799E|nr:hypothetical protein [Eggerthella timonensis]